MSEEMEDHNKEQKMNEGTNSARINRNLLERNRRASMKDLFSKLFSVIPTTQNSKASVPEILEQATTYINQLQEKIGKLREKKEVLLKGDKDFEPVMNIKTSDYSLEVTIISGLKQNFLLHQVISVLQDEGAQVLNTTCHSVGDRVFYRIYSQATCSRIGIDASRVDERLKKLIF